MAISKDALSRLHPDVKAHLSRFNINTPTPAQEITIGPIMEGRNALLVSPTGMGKTEAVMLPLFSRLLDMGKAEGISIIYITPLRALNRDMVSRMEKWGEALGLDVKVRHGDTPRKERAALSKNPPDVLITTPETMQILFSGKRLRAAMATVRAVVIDEIHELAESSRGAQLMCALERLKHYIGRDFQRIGMSATVGNPHTVAEFLRGSGPNVDVLIAGAEKGFDVQILYPPPASPSEAEKLGTTPEMASAVMEIARLIEENTSVIVFVNTRDSAEFLGSRLNVILPDMVDVHHGSLSASIRTDIESRFKKGELKAIVATSSLELGIDIGSVDFIVQFSSPRRVARLLQRVGRSGHHYRRVSRGAIIATSLDDAAETCAIISLMKSGYMEDVRIRPNPLDVLANQIAAYMALYDEYPARKMYREIRGAYTFRHLQYEDFLDVVGALLKSRLLYVDDIETYKALVAADFPSVPGDFLIKRGGRRIEYFYDNISMIPDESVYLVVGRGGGVIGTMDESFVVMDLEEGMIVTLRGKSWRVVEIRPPEGDTKGKVVVDYIADFGEPPRWVGEEIPVEMEVALLAADIRKDPNSSEEAVSSGISNRMADELEPHREMGLPVPDGKTILVEGGRDAITVNIPYGHRVNTAISQVLVDYIARVTGSPVYQSIDPYRCMFSFDGIVHPDKIKAFLEGLDGESFRDHLMNGMAEASRIKWAVFHTARKFGAISKKADIHKVARRSLVGLYRDTVIYRESVDRDIWEHMDVEKAIGVVDSISRGEINVVTYVGVTPIGEMGSTGCGGVISPDSADIGILKALKKRLEGNVVRTVCMNCYSTRRRIVSELKTNEQCDVCGSVMVSMIREWDRESLDLLLDIKREGLRKRTEKKKKLLRELMRVANIIRPDFRHGAMALCARGVGPETAARILARTLPIGEDEVPFLREVLRAEVNYARYRKFW